MEILHIAFKAENTLPIWKQICLIQISPKNRELNVSCACDTRQRDRESKQELKQKEEKQGGFPGSSASKESTCNAGDPGSISGSGRASGEGIGYPLQYFWASCGIIW